MDLSVTNLKGQSGRRVILLFTDGADNPMNFKLNNLSFMDVQRRAQEADVMVYAIGLESRDTVAIGGGGGGIGGGFGGTSRPDPGLPAIAGETGGGYFELRNSGRPGVNIRARRRRTASPVPHWLRAAEAGRQDAQAGSEGPQRRNEGARPQGIPRRRHEVGPLLP